jgi:hypothetical protein
MLSSVLYQDKAFSLWDNVWPGCDTGSLLQTLYVLLGLDSILTFLPVEKWDVRGSSHSVVSNKGCLKSIRHFEWSVVQCGDA